MNLYDKDRNIIALGQFYTDHISAMTREGLRAKSDIASELAFRDKQIAERDETIRQLRAEAAKWERLHDELYAEIAGEHRRDEYGETETAAECVRRVVRERDQLRAQLDEYERAPTFTCMYRFPHMGGFVWRHSSSDFNGARPVESIELIARPTRKDGE